MILELTSDMTEVDKTALVAMLQARGCDLRELPDTDVQRIGVMNPKRHPAEFFRKLPGVARTVAVGTPYKLVGRQMHPQDTLVQRGRCADRWRPPDGHCRPVRRRKPRAGADYRPLGQEGRCGLVSRRGLQTADLALFFYS